MKLTEIKWPNIKKSYIVIWLTKLCELCSKGYVIVSYKNYDPTWTGHGFKCVIASLLRQSQVKSNQIKFQK